MFNHILVPVSDDPINKAELKEVVKLAKIDQSKITLTYVSDPLGPYMYSDISNQFVMTEQEHQKVCKEFAKRLFEKSKALIPEEFEVDTLHVFHANIAGGIIEAAHQCKADVIMMASHKRSGISGFFLRGEAHEVILFSKLPVLILNI